MVSTGWVLGFASFWLVGCGDSATVTLELRAHNPLPAALTRARFTIAQVTVEPADASRPFRHPAALLGDDGDATFDLASLSEGVFAGELDLPRVPLGEVRMTFETLDPHPDALPLGPNGRVGISFNAALSPSSGASDHIRLLIDFDSTASVVTLTDGGYLFDPHATLQVTR